MSDKRDEHDKQNERNEPDERGDDTSDDVSDGEQSGSDSDVTLLQHRQREPPAKSPRKRSSHKRRKRSVVHTMFCGDKCRVCGQVSRIHIFACEFFGAQNEPHITTCITAHLTANHIVLPGRHFGKT